MELHLNRVAAARVQQDLWNVAREHVADESANVAIDDAPLLHSRNDRREVEPVSIELGTRVPGGAIRYMLSNHRTITIAIAVLWAGMMGVQVLYTLVGTAPGNPMPWWGSIGVAPFLLLGLYRRGLDVHQDEDKIVLWRSFGFRLWSRSVPLAVPEVIRRQVDVGSEHPGRTRKHTSLFFGEVAMKDVTLKNLGTFMREIEWLVAEKKTTLPNEA